MLYNRPYSERAYKIKINKKDWSDDDLLQMYVMDMIGGLLNIKAQKSASATIQHQIKQRIFWKTLQHISAFALSDDQETETSSFFCDKMSPKILMVEVGCRYIVQLYVLILM